MITISEQALKIATFDQACISWLKPTCLSKDDLQPNRKNLGPDYPTGIDGWLKNQLSYSPSIAYLPKSTRPTDTMGVIRNITIIAKIRSSLFPEVNFGIPN